MIAIWYVEGKYQSNNSVSDFSGVICTSGPKILPKAERALGNSKQLIAITNIKLLVDFDKQRLDFVENQSVVE